MLGVIVNVTMKRYFYSNVDDDCKTARDDGIFDCHVDFNLRRS